VRGGGAHSCKPLRSNAESSCETVATSNDVNTKAEESTALEAIKRQIVKTTRTEKT
jgi:hypothetical protein